MRQADRSVGGRASGVGVTGSSSTRSRVQDAPRPHSSAFVWTVVMLAWLLGVGCGAELSQHDLMAPFATADGGPWISCRLDVGSSSSSHLALRLILRNASRRRVYVYVDPPPVHNLPYLWLEPDEQHLTVAWRAHPYRKRSDDVGTLFVPGLRALEPGDEVALPVDLQLPLVERDKLGPYVAAADPQPHGAVIVHGEIGFFPFGVDDRSMWSIDYYTFYTEQVVCTTSQVLWAVGE